jgi:hypothetical protein
MADDDDGIEPGDDAERVIAYKYVAEWKFTGAVKSADPNATPFGGDPWPESHGTIVPDNPPSDRGFFASLFSSTPPKTVDYVPVKRRNGKDTFPTLIVSIRLTNLKGAQPARVRAWVGTSVEVTVVNVLPGNSDQKNAPGELNVSLQGKLDSNLSCQIKIPPSDVEAWLKKDSALQAAVNENLLDFRFKLTGVSDGGRPVEGQAQRRLFLYCRKTVVLLPGLFASQVQFTAADGQIVGFPDFFDEAEINSFDSSDDAGGAVMPAVSLNISQNAEVLECDDKGIPLIPCEMPTLLMLKGAVISPYEALHDARVALLPHVPEKFQLYTLIACPYDWRGDLTDSAAALVNQLADLQGGQPKKGPTLKAAPDTDDRVVAIGHSTGGVVIRRALAPIAASECTDPSSKLATTKRPAADTLINLAFFLSVPFSGAPKAGAVLLTGLDSPEGARQIPFINPESLVSIALTMPIVYHLHTSVASQHRPATSPSAPLSGLAPEADKSSFVLDAMLAGLLPETMAVDASQAKDPELRRSLAMNSGAWHQFVRDYHEISSGLSYDKEHKYTPWERGGVDGWYTLELAKRGLQQQWDIRGTTGWNTYLANRARIFHEKSAKAITPAWKDRTAIFWGSCEETPTFRQLNLLRFGPDQPTYYPITDFEKKRRINDLNRWMYGLNKVTRAQLVGYEGGRRDFTQYRRPLLMSAVVAEIFWRLAWVRQLGAGDGTVPTDSQLAEQPNVHATYSTLAPEDTGLSYEYKDPPEHMASPKSPYVWKVLVTAIHNDKLADETDEVAAARATYMDRLTHPAPPDLPFYGP